MEDHFPVREDTDHTNKVLYKNNLLVSFDDPYNDNSEIHNYLVVVTKLSIEVYQSDPHKLYYRWNLFNLDQITKTRNGFICFTFILPSCMEKSGNSRKFLQVKEISNFSGQILLLMEVVAQVLTINLQQRSSGKRLKEESTFVEEVGEESYIPKSSRNSKQHNKNSKKSPEELKKEKWSKTRSISEFPVHKKNTETEDFKIPDPITSSSTVTIGEDNRKLPKRKSRNRKISGNSGKIPINPENVLLHSRVPEKPSLNPSKIGESVPKGTIMHTRTLSTRFKKILSQSQTEEDTLNQNLSPRNTMEDSKFSEIPNSPREFPDMENKTPKNCSENSFPACSNSAPFVKKYIWDDFEDRKNIFGKSENNSEDKKNYGKLEKRKSVKQTSLQLTKFFENPWKFKKNRFPDEADIDSVKFCEGGTSGPVMETFPPIPKPINKFLAGNPPPPEKFIFPENSVTSENQKLPENFSFQDDFLLNTKSSLTEEVSIISGKNLSQNRIPKFISGENLSQNGKMENFRRRSTHLREANNIWDDRCCKEGGDDNVPHLGEELVEEDLEIPEERRKVKRKITKSMRKRNCLACKIFGKEKTEILETEFCKKSPNPVLNGVPALACNCVMCQWEIMKSRKELSNNENVPPTSATTEPTHSHTAQTPLQVSNMIQNSSTSGFPEKSIQSIPLQDLNQGTLKQYQKPRDLDQLSLSLSTNINTSLNMDYSPKTEAIHLLQEMLTLLYDVYNDLVDGDTGEGGKSDTFTQLFGDV